MKLTLAYVKDTKRKVAYGDQDGHSIYLDKEEAKKLGNPEAIKVAITA